MSVIVTGNDELFAAWAAKQIPIIAHRGFGPCKTLTFATGYEATDQLLAVCVFHDFDPKYMTIGLSFASNPVLPVRWCTRGNIRAILAIPFEQYKVRKVRAIFDIKNKAAERLRQLVGFKIEGYARDEFGPKHHAVLTGMLKREYEATWGSTDPKAHRSPAKAVRVQPDQLHAG